MTEYWVSNKMHWCELCRCWMNDTKAALANHERGTQHQAALAKKLRDMSRKAATEKAEKEAASAAMDAIEAAARKQYEADTAAAAAAMGSWSWTAESGYYYNAVHRWYYDPKTKWYYGGDPVSWTQSPALPSGARFGVAPHEGGPVPQPAAVGSSTSGSSVPTCQAAGGGGGGGGGGGLTVKRTIALPSHPQAAVGGHQMPIAGKIGGAKGVGSSKPGSSTDKHVGGGGAAAAAAAARKRPMDPAEAAALARREAARKRVEERTKTSFGLT